MSGDMIKSYFDRWQRMEADKQEISADLRDLFAEAKSHGYDTKALRKSFRRAVDLQERAQEVEEAEAIIALYVDAIMGHPRAYPRDARESEAA